jgi:hypothetical protein
MTNSSEQCNELPGRRKSGEYKVSGPGNAFSRKRISGTREQVELHLYGRLQFVSENSKLNYSQVQILSAPCYICAASIIFNIVIPQFFASIQKVCRDFSVQAKITHVHFQEGRSSIFLLRIVSSP